MQPLLGLLERLRRDVDQVTRALAPRAGSASASSTSFSPLPQPSSTIVPVEPRRARDDLARVRAEQPRLGPRDAIPRQPADRLEQARAERVVEILRLQLLRRQREIARDVGGELGATNAGDAVASGRRIIAPSRNFA